MFSLQDQQSCVSTHCQACCSSERMYLRAREAGLSRGESEPQEPSPKTMLLIPSPCAFRSFQASSHVWCWGFPGSNSVYTPQTSPLSIRGLFLLLLPLMCLWLSSATAKRVALHWCRRRGWFPWLRVKDLVLPLSDVQVTIMYTGSTNMGRPHLLKASPHDSWCQAIVAAKQRLCQDSQCALPRSALSRLNVFVINAAHFLKPEKLRERCYEATLCFVFVLAPIAVVPP